MGAGLIGAWFSARSVARGLPLPIRDPCDALRVDTDTPQERRRYLFATAGPAFKAFAGAVDEPAIALRVCVEAALLPDLLPPRWRLGAPAFVMIGDAARAVQAALPQGYRTTIDRAGGRSRASILSADGTLAASGWCAEFGGVFVYDRIVTEPAHRRRGLGTAIMASLGALRCDPRSIPILTATSDGRALYATLGWRDVSPYSSASIPIG